MKTQLFKKAVSMTLVSAMALGMTACGGNADAGTDAAATASPSQSETAGTEGAQTDSASDAAASDVNYKGNVNYVDIAHQLQADQALDLKGLNSEKFTITGYAQGYDFDDAWMGSITQMASSGCEVILGSGSSDFAFNFGGVDRTNADVKVGGVD